MERIENRFWAFSMKKQLSVESCYELNYGFEFEFDDVDVFKSLLDLFNTREAVCDLPFR